MSIGKKISAYPGCGRRNFRINRFVCRRRWRRFIRIVSNKRQGRGFIREYGCFRNPLILRRATSADKSAVMDLWQTCFHDDPRFLEPSFSRKFSPDRCCVVVRGRDFVRHCNICHIHCRYGAEKSRCLIGPDCRLIPRTWPRIHGCVDDSCFYLVVSQGILVGFSDSGREVSGMIIMGVSDLKRHFIAGNIFMSINGVLPASVCGARQYVR